MKRAKSYAKNAQARSNTLGSFLLPASLFPQAGLNNRWDQAWAVSTALVEPCAVTEAASGSSVLHCLWTWKCILSHCVMCFYQLDPLVYWCRAKLIIQFKLFINIFYFFCSRTHDIEIHLCHSQKICLKIVTLQPKISAKYLRIHTAKFIPKSHTNLI